MTVLAAPLPGASARASVRGQKSSDPPERITTRRPYATRKHRGSKNRWNVLRGTRTDSV